MIVWTDVETSDLDERKGHLLEVALVVTDDNLKERAAVTTVCKPVGIEIDEMVKGMPLVIQEMHEKSGLIADLKKPEARRRHEAEEFLIAWLGETFGRIEDLRQVPLAGSTVSFDRRWERQHMEKLEALFSYRSIDVSAFTEMAGRWSPAIYNDRPKKDKGVAHRALDDARQSIATLRFYKGRGFVGGIAG